MLCRFSINCEKKLFHDIENFEIAKNAYDFIVKIYKSKKFNAFIVIYFKFEIFKITNCVFVNEYDIKFRNIINELIIYSFNSKINQN